MELILKSTSLDESSNAFAAAIRPFGINAFAIGLMPALDELGGLFVNRWPNWIDYYAVNGFAHNDIALDEIERSLDPFTWTELRKRRPGEGARVFDACSGFGWNDGFIVPVAGPNGQRGFVSLAAPSSLASLDSIKRAELTQLSRAVYTKTRALTIEQQGAIPRLSDREREALSLVASGRNDADIAAIMRISTSTAHAHVERAKRRLGANTRAQAVALALRAKII